MFITGDMHGFYDFYKLEEFAESEQGKNLTKKDYVTICGDFGGIWNWCLTGNSVPSNPKDVRWTIEELEQKHKIEEFPFTTLFLDGNHENFSRLNSYPVEMWNGGKVHKISDSIIHLMRGQVYEIEGSTIFTFGGAASHDRGPATGTQLFDHGVSWWPEEICSQAERDEAVRNLAEHGVDGRLLKEYLRQYENPGSRRSSVKHADRTCCRLYETREICGCPDVLET